MVEKIKNTIKNNNDKLYIIIFAVTIFLTCISAFVPILISGDELWNFNNIYKMYNGYTIYKDTNVIITPLFCIVGNLLFNIFGANMFVFRVYNVLLYMLLYLVIYILLKKLKINKIKSMSYVLVVGEILFKIISGGANYNIFSIIFVISGMIIEIANKEKTYKYKYDILQGIFIFLIFLTKQNIAVFYIIGIVMYRMFIDKDNKNKIKSILVTFSIALMLFITFIIILLKLGILESFINMAVLGLREFGAENIHVNIRHMIAILILGVSIAAVILVYKFKVKDKEQEQYDNMKFLVTFAIPMLFITYPIANTHHVMVASIVSIILIIYIIETLILNDIINEKLSKKAFKIIVGMILIELSLFYFGYFNYASQYASNKKLEYSNPYFGITITKEIETNIENVTKYINESDEEVIILSNRAALYMIPFKRNNGIMDLPFFGNMGKDGEEELLKQISQLSNTQILIYNGEREYQESEKAIEYIKNNFEQIGEIEEFLIYKTKK